MARRGSEVKVRGLGAAGISQDLNPADVPLNLWTAGENVIFSEEMASNTPAAIGVFEGLHGYAMFQIERRNGTTGNYELVYVSRDTTTGLDSIYIIKPENFGNTDGSEKGVLMSGALPAFTDTSALVTNPWQGFVSNGVVVINNGQDAPVVCFPDSDLVVTMPNWPATLRADIIEPFKTSWVALNVYDGTAAASYERQPSTLHWSQPTSAHGSVPASWLATDPGAGFQDLIDTPGPIVAARALRDKFLIFKSSSVVAMEYTGNIDAPWAWRNLFNDVGAFDKDSVADLGGKLVVISQADIYETDGVNRKSIVTGKIRREIFEKYFSDGGVWQSAIGVDYQEETAFFVFNKSLGDTDYSILYQFNYRTSSWSSRSFTSDFGGAAPLLRSSSYSRMDTVASSGQTFDGTPLTFDSQSAETFDDISAVSNSPFNLVFAIGTELYTINSRYSTGTRQSFTLEKHDVDFGEMGLASESGKSVYGVWPRCKDSTGIATLTIWGHDYAGQSIPDSWKQVIDIDLASGFRWEPRVNGRYISFTITGLPGSVMNLSSVDMDIRSTSRS